MRKGEDSCQPVHSHSLNSASAGRTWRQDDRSNLCLEFQKPYVQATRHTE